MKQTGIKMSQDPMGTGLGFRGLRWDWDSHGRGLGAARSADPSCCFPLPGAGAWSSVDPHHSSAHAMTDEEKEHACKHMHTHMHTVYSSMPKNVWGGIGKLCILCVFVYV